MAKGKPGASKKEVEKKVNKIVEDKTFGLKNKNKSKKVQEFVQQVKQVANASKSGGQVHSAEYYAAQEAKKKKEREEKKLLEKEMTKLLDAKKKEEEDKRKVEELKRLEEEKKAQVAYEHDFSIPITSLEQIFKVDGKSLVPRACGELIWKDNLTLGNTKKMLIKVSDGSTRLPLPVVLIGWTPSTFSIKQGSVVDIRNAIAMIRGEQVDLELTLGGGGVIEEASPRLSQHILDLKRELEETRERGGIPLEELIEEQRSKLRSQDLTPGTRNFLPSSQ